MGEPGMGRSKKRSDILKSVFGLSFVISIFLHVLIVLLSQLSDHGTLLEKLGLREPKKSGLDPKTLYVELLDSSTIGGQVVESSKAPETLLEKKSFEPAYKAEFTQRVKKQSIRPGIPSASSTPQEETQASQKKEKRPSLKDLGLSSSIGAMTLSSPIAKFEKENTSGSEKGKAKLPYQKAQLGTQDLVAPNIAIGVDTLLNTNEYRHASFYNRLKREVGARWDPLVSTVIKHRAKEISPGIYQSKAVMLLDNEGEVKEVYITKRSGLLFFDDAAVTAIKQTLRFQNPPKELLESDGFYRINIAFLVDLDNQNAFRMQFQSARQGSL